MEKIELKITDTVIGTGTAAVKGALIICHYEGFLENGTKIANLVSHNHKGMTSEPNQESEKIFFA